MMESTLINTLLTSFDFYTKFSKLKIKPILFDAFFILIK